MVVDACDEDALLGDLPVFAGGVLKLKGRALKVIEAPVAAD